MKDQFEITKTKPSDIEACFNLSKTKELEYAPDIYPSKEELKSGLKKGIMFSAKINNQLAGFVLGYYMSRQNGYIDLLIVHKSYRNMGIGTQLLNSIIREMKKEGVSSIWLIAHENKKDLTFYHKKGFSEGDRFRLFWKDI